MGVAMRGHGLYICVGLGIPCLAFSTQDKVAGFARICKFDDYLIDTQRPTWLNDLKHSILQLRSNQTYIKRWYELRDACLDQWNCVARRFHAHISNSLPRPQLRRT